MYCTVLYYTVLYYTVLYYTVQYYAVLCSTVLYCTVLYCTVLHCTVHNVLSLLGLQLLHHLLPGTLRTHNIRPVLYEPLPHHGLLADVTVEAVIVPGQGLEGNKLGAA